MAETLTIAAKKRDRAGRGGARASRREGLIPAVIYGDNQAPLNIALEPKQISREIHREGFFNHRMALDVEGTKVDVLPRDVQLDPVSDRPIHFDFLRVGANTIVAVQVPVHFRNEAGSPGIKRGGVLNIIMHEISVRTRADRIPEFFEVDLTGLEIGHSVHLSALKVPEGIKVIARDRNATIASIAPPTVVRVEAQEAATATTAPAAAAAATPAAGATPAPGAAPAAAPADKKK